MAWRRIGCIGDVHCEDALLAAAIAALRGLGVDAIVCTGDLADGAGDLERVVALLRDHDVHTVRGNHDRWLLAGELRTLSDATLAVSPAARAWLAALPATRTLPTVAGGLRLCHGVDADDMLRLRPGTVGYDLEHMDALHALRRDPAVALMVGGHTHRAMSRRFDGLWVVNPGTLHRRYPQGLAVVDAAAGTAEYRAWDGAAFAPAPWPG
jgi:predicted phosphodiesterase